ncbi:hypothetical protein JH26_05195 [Microvirga sp. BSC39]|nr:hypothetical protein JH26_05195 [Microvirga sp. BSC39]
MKHICIAIIKGKHGTSQRYAAFLQFVHKPSQWYHLPFTRQYSKMISEVMRTHSKLPGITGYFRDSMIHQHDWPLVARKSPQQSLCSPESSHQAITF